MTQTEFKDLLLNKIGQVSIKAIRDDVIRFVPDDQQLQIWSPEYFKELSKRIRFV